MGVLVMVETSCFSGCKHFPNGDTVHHKDCPLYENSLSKKYELLQKKLNSIEIVLLADIKADIMRDAQTLCDNGMVHKTVGYMRVLKIIESTFTEFFS